METPSASQALAASSRPSPIEIWQTLLTYLFDRHYGLTLNDTPFSYRSIIEEHIEAGISLKDAVNFVVERYGLLRIDRSSCAFVEQPSFISYVNILQARRATALMNQEGYKEISLLTQGKKTTEGRTNENPH
ncbi:TA system toxin CbtA family protein [Rahnella aceris]